MDWHFGSNGHRPSQSSHEDNSSKCNYSLCVGEDQPMPPFHNRQSPDCQRNGNDVLLKRSHSSRDGHRDRSAASPSPDSVSSLRFHYVQRNRDRPKIISSLSYFAAKIQLSGHKSKRLRTFFAEIAKICVPLQQFCEN